MAGKPFRKPGRKRWYAVIELPPDPETGRRRQRTVSGATRKECQDRQVALLRELATGTHFDPTAATVADYLAHWLETVVRPNTALRTAEQVAVRLRVWVRPHLGGVRLAELRAAQVAALLARIVAAGRSPRTAALVRTDLHGALDQAVRWQLIARNVVDDVSPPRYAPTPAPLWDGPTLARFLARVTGHLHEALWRTLLNTGLRLGEVLALTWGDVDLARGHLAVRRNLIQARGVALHAAATKGRRGRGVELTPATVATLRAHRGQVAPPADALIFGNPDGGYRRQEPIRRSWTRALARWGLPHIRLHDLRHLHATYLIIAGVPARVIADRLGHSSTQVTNEVYVHVLSAMQQDAATRFDAVMEQVVAHERAENTPENGPP